MSEIEYEALVVNEADGVFSINVETKKLSELPEGDVLVRVHYSSLNYKDALSAIGNKGVTRNYPHIPGIDAVGVVVKSDSAEFSEGDEVIVTSYDLGMNTSGGFAEYIRVPSSWVLKLPKGLSMKESMVFGTAGLTAGMSVLKLTEQVKPEDGKIIVSGGTGGVGSLAVAILSKLGYEVVAITGKTDKKDYLENLGASEIISRDDFLENTDKLMLRTEYAGAIDTVGGDILGNMIKSIKPLGVVTCCGNVASGNLNTNVYPFILRGISLIGIDSQNCPMEIRKEVWNKLASDWKIDILEFISKEIGLDGLEEEIKVILDGKVMGRIVVKI